MPGGTDLYLATPATPRCLHLSTAALPPFLPVCTNLANATLTANQESIQPPVALVFYESTKTETRVYC